MSYPPNFDKSADLPFRFFAGETPTCKHPRLPRNRVKLALFSVLRIKERGDTSEIAHTEKMRRQEKNLKSETHEDLCTFVSQIKGCLYKKFETIRAIFWNNP